MNSLKSVAEKMKRSPKIMRKKFAGQYDHLNQHQELSEDLLNQPETLGDGIPFYCKWLGSCQVFKPQGTGCTDTAVKSIVEYSKKTRKSKDECKLQKVLLTVSDKFLTIVDMTTKVLKIEVPIYRISYCTTDLNCPKVFAFVAREQKSKVLQCYALLCNKESMAQALSLTVADAFSSAYQSFEEVNQAKKKQVLHDMSASTADHSTTQPDKNPISLLLLSKSVSLPDEDIPLSADDTTLKALECEAHSNNNYNQSYSANPFIQHNVIQRSSSELHDGKSFLRPKAGKVTSTRPWSECLSTSPCIDLTGDEFLSSVTDAVSDSTNITKALDLAVDDDFDAEFTQLAEFRSNSNLFETPVRKSGLQDGVTMLLANEKTAYDFMRSRSKEDLLFM